MGNEESKPLRVEDLSDSEDIFDEFFPGNGVIKMGLNHSSNSFYKSIMKYGPDEVYAMSGGCRGRCLIINNNKFEHSCTRPGSISLSERKGSELDVINLEKVFASLGFKVIIEKDVKSHDLAAVVEKELIHQDHKRLGMFVFIIMSHGGQGHMIYGTDNVCVDLHSLFKQIYNCEPLRNKPKLIVVQACAGDDLAKGSYDSVSKFDEPSPHNEDAIVSASNQQECHVPHDVLILRSASYGFKSIRLENLGSPLIRALVEALAKHSHNCDLKTICKQVQKKMRNYRERNSSCPLSSIDLQLRKKVYLFPGISMKKSTEKNFTKSSIEDTIHRLEGEDSRFHFSMKISTEMNFTKSSKEDTVHGLEEEGEGFLCKSCDSLVKADDYGDLWCPKCLKYLSSNACTLVRTTRMDDTRMIDLLLCCFGKCSQKIHTTYVFMKSTDN